jgi:pSer/pThr/pTyr-binding forkhead associated (FHA) protein
MRIEVLVGNDEPIIYPINSSKMVIGSAEGADIVISDKGISRKHILIISENDSYFVVDQGSTNGSYVNEERLIPGRKVEFTSFFPVRLGSDVLLSLLSDEEEMKSTLIEIPSSAKVKSSEPRNNSTRVISLKELQKPQTEKLIRSLNEKKSAKNNALNKTPAKKKKPRNWMPYLTLTFFLGVAVYNIYFAPKISDQPDQTTQERPGDREVVLRKPKAPKVPRLIPVDELLPQEKLVNAYNELKCITEEEKKMCDGLGLSGEWGVTQIGLNFIITNLVDDSLMRSQEILKNSEETDLLKEVTLAVYLSAILESKIEFDLKSDIKIYVALFKKVEGASPQLFVSGAFYPKTFLKLKNILSLGSLTSAQNGGMDALIEFKKHYISRFQTAPL